ncbi:hypothetical protein BJ165DRAFT_26702 [Panaeolus papilionaceus]|nr:hypothetical protein BJ165DRAFT_26702 [Panaeolus papilionaceus]
MSLATCTRRRVTSLYLSSRSVSTKVQPISAAGAAPKVQSHASLPPAKVRALISLYHQADSWITPENLLDRIDEAFLPTVGKNVLVEETPEMRMQSMASLPDLRNALRKMKTAPKMAQWDTDTTKKDYVPGEQWSDVRSKREMKVIEALYGVNTTVKGKILPGLDALEEVKGSLKDYVREDKHDDEDDLDGFVR